MKKEEHTLISLDITTSYGLDDDKKKFGLFREDGGTLIISSRGCRTQCQMINYILSVRSFFHRPYGCPWPLNPPILICFKVLTYRLIRWFGILIERIRIGVRSRLVQLLLGPGALECECHGTGAQTVSMWLCICPKSSSVLMPEDF